MTNDDVWGKTFHNDLAQRHCRTKAISSSGFPSLGQAIGLFVCFVVTGIDYSSYTVELGWFLALKKDDLVLALFTQPLNKFSILARHILVNKK
jgi:hypothetical protein